MSNYSELFNDHVYTINSKAVSLGSGTPFISGSEASITQQTFLNVTQSGVSEITHAEDSDYTRLVQVLEKVAGSTGLTNTTLDFDLADEGYFIQEDSVSGTDFVGGVIKLHATPTLIPTTEDHFDPTTADGAMNFYNNNKTVSATDWHAVKSLAETGPGETTYFEYYLDEFSGDLFMLGVIPSSNTPSNYGAGGIFLYNNGRIRYGGAYYDLTGGTPISSYTTGDIIGVVVEDGYRMHFYKGNDYMGYYDGPADTWSPCVSLYGPMTVTCRLVTSETTLSAKQGGTDGFFATSSIYQYSSSTLTREEAENDNAITDFGAVTIVAEDSGVNTMPAINITNDSSYMIVSTSPSILLGSGDFTIEFDVNLTSHGYVISNNYGDANSWFVMTSVSYLRFYSYHGSTYIDWTDAEAILSYGTDYHVALVRSGTNFDLYVDGSKVGTTKTLADNFNTSTSTLGIGARRDGSIPTFTGKLNNVEISNSARYTSNFTPSTTVHEPQADTLFLLRVKRYTTDNSKYVTTSDDNHIDLTAFDVINSCSITSTTPTDTDIKALVSFDGRTTWKTWNGSSFDTYSGGLSDKTSWNTTSGLEAGLTNLTVTSGMSYLDFAFNLNTDVSTSTPELDQVTINYDEEGYYATASEDDYNVDFFSSTVTKVTKLSSGTAESVKINIAL